MDIVIYIFQVLVSFFPDMVKIVTLQGRPKSNRKQLPHLNFDFTVESIGKSGSLPPPTSHKKQTLELFQFAVIHNRRSSRIFFGQDINDFKMKSFHVNTDTCEPKLITSCVKYSHQKF